MALAQMKMMNDTNKLIVDKLKGLIDKNGPDCFRDDPYSVYKELVETVRDSTMIAGAILMLMSTGMWDGAKLIKDYEVLSSKIQKESFFKKKMSDQLAEIILSLYSEDNKAEWRHKRNEGLTQFLQQDHTFKWDGFSVWYEGNGTVDCFYSAEMVLLPTEGVTGNKDLQMLIKKNPFMTMEAIFEFFESMLKEYLDSEFEEYCTCDDYYQPVVEDFELTYYVEKWCKENGFEPISCEGEGGDGGYDPKTKRGWY